MRAQVLLGTFVVLSHILPFSYTARPAFADESAMIQRIQPQPAQALAQAVRVDDAHLVHTTQLLPRQAGQTDAAQQSADVLAQLDGLLEPFASKPSDVVKLNVYVKDANVRRAFVEKLSSWCGAEFPSVTYVATALPDARAAVGLDAVFVAREVGFTESPSFVEAEAAAGGSRGSLAALLPKGDVVYVSGQAEPGNLPDATRDTLAGLLRTLEHLKLERAYIVQLKCFLLPMTDVAGVNAQIAEFFGDAPIPPVVHVEWISGSHPIEIELIAWAPPEKSDDSVSYSGLPWMKSSPVYSRVARIHGNQRIYISGLNARQAGDAAGQVRAVFEKLHDVASAAGTDLKHLAKATYYVSEDEASSQLNALRPNYYDPERPPAASKAMVKDIAAPGSGLTLDMIAAPTE